MKLRHLLTAVAASLFVISGAAHAVDADAAKAMAKKQGCLKCHSEDKEKKGPSMKKISADLKGKPDAMDRVMKAMTTGPKVKLSDGSEEEHKVAKGSDAELKNLAEWFLSH